MPCGACLDEDPYLCLRFRYKENPNDETEPEACGCSCHDIVEDVTSSYMK